MTDQLDGRDLDRACAEAMGWTTKEFSSATALVRGKELVWQPPRYSTDPSTQAEKLAFLRQQKVVAKAGYVISRVEEIRISEIVEDCPEPVRVEAIGLPPPATAYGATIDQALARLVCAVAKAKKGQGK